MNILIVGNQGYIGTVMVEELLKKGHRVSGYDTRFFEKNDLINSDNKIDQIKKDIRHVSKEDLGDIDAIFFLAALSNDPTCDIDPRLTEEINHKAAINFAKLAKLSGISRFVFSSSCSVYGAAGDNIITEDSKLNPLSVYAKYKWKTENELMKLADSEFCPVFMRNATAFGLSPRMRLDLVVNNLTAWAFTTGKVKLLSDGSAWRPNVHIRDISNAFIATLNEDEDILRNKILNVGMNSETLRVKEIAQIVLGIVPNSEIEYAGGDNFDPRTYRVEFDRIFQVLKKFKPEWTIKMGVKEIYIALKKANLSQEEMENETFHNIKRMKNLLQTKLTEDMFWK